MNEGKSKILVPPRTLDHWYRTYTPHLLRYLRKYGLNTQETEDIVSETWLTIMRSGYNGSGVFHAFIRKIAQRKALDVLRHQRRRTEVIQAEIPHVSWRHTLEIRRALASMCLKLSLRQQEAFICIHYAALTYPEAAARMHVPVSTLKTRMRRATAVLREPARYSTYPTAIALPVGYAPAEGWRMLPQEDQEYTLFTRDTEVSALEVVCRADA